jgi:hypothetical protein
VSQLNLNMTPELEEALKRFMRLRGIRTKSEALRVAVREGVERSIGAAPRASFASWLGAAARAPENPNPRFATDDDLWS